MWVALKGAVAVHPKADRAAAPDAQEGISGRKTAEALDRMCCDPSVLEQNMGTLQTRGLDL